jgi:hypothetical protein
MQRLDLKAIMVDGNETRLLPVPIKLVDDMAASGGALW